jgi:pteridine reductase
LNLSNKQEPRVALVTGAARRIGAAITKHLHATGFQVLIHCHHSKEAAYKLMAELNTLRENSARMLSVDLCKQTSSHQLIAAVMQWTGRLDLLVHNASIFSQDDEADWDKLFTTNVKAPYWLSQEAFPHLAATSGAIINITDIHAEQPLKNYAMYCQSKAALAMQTKALAQQFAPRVRVNAVAPGAIAWPENKNELSISMQEKIIKKTLLKRQGEPTFIAQAVMALVENPFITGQTLRVDGGR